MNDFDKAARRAVKDAGADHIAWIFPNLAGALAYDDWLDAQSAPRPNEPDRRCDTIARLLPPKGDGPAWAAVIEFFTDADNDALDRTAKYVWTYRNELRYGPDKYEMAAAMVFLTDAPKELGADHALPGGESRFTALPKPVLVSVQDALATMAGIRDNRLGPGILPWVPLMQGGQTTEAAAEWKRTAEEKEPRPLRQREMAGLAWVFTDLAGCRDSWETVLEGFGMRESTVGRMMRNEGRNEGALTRGRDDLSRLLKLRFKEAVPPSLYEKVKGETRLDVLTGWFDKAATEDLAEVRKAMGE